MSATEPTMAKYLDRLTHIEQQIICNQVRLRSEEQRYAHLGPHLLPFVPVSEVHLCLRRAIAVRPVAAIISKLQVPSDFTDLEVLTLTLADRKVHRMFGSSPEKGRAITWLPGKPVVSLRRQLQHRSPYDRPGFGSWEISVPKKHRAAVAYWLHDICGSLGY